GEAADRRAEVAEEDAASVLAVGHDLETEVLLETDHVPDVAVLLGAERICRETTLLPGPARRHELGRPEGAPHVLGANRRRRAPRRSIPVMAPPRASSRSASGGRAALTHGHAERCCDVSWLRERRGRARAGRGRLPTHRDAS